VGNKRNRNKQLAVIDAEFTAIETTDREKIQAELRKQGFTPENMSEYELAMLVQVGVATNEIIAAIDELGAMLEDVLAPEEDAG